ncbi:MAG: hypothetical protein ACW98I_12965 [Candidatus Hodarchaeales archaeon]
MKLRIRNRLNENLYTRLYNYKYVVLVALLSILMLTVVMGTAPPTTSPPGGMGG